MSYSFSISAASKPEVLAKLSEELDKVVASQPVHAKDRQQAQAAAEAFIALLPEDEAKNIAVSLSGWVSGSWGPDGTLPVIGSASVNVSVGLSAK